MGLDLNIVLYRFLLGSTLHRVLHCGNHLLLHDVSNLARSLHHLRVNLFLDERLHAVVDKTGANLFRLNLALVALADTVQVTL